MGSWLSKFQDVPQSGTDSTDSSLAVSSVSTPHGIFARTTYGELSGYFTAESIWQAFYKWYGDQLACGVSFLVLDAIEQQIEHDWNLESSTLAQSTSSEHSFNYQSPLPKIIV